MAKDGKKKKDELKALYIHAESFADLIRCAVVERQTKIMAIKEGKNYRLMVETDRTEGLRIICYYDVEKIENYISYTIDYENAEKTEMKNNIALGQDHFKVYHLPIVEITSNPYMACKKEDMKNISVVEAKEHTAIIKALISSMSEDDSMPKLYSFSMKGQRFIGSFEIFWDRGRIFTFAKINQKEGFKGVSYDYTTDQTSMTNNLSESSKITVRVINLSEPFPFIR